MASHSNRRNDPPAPSTSLAPPAGAMEFIRNIILAELIVEVVVLAVAIVVAIEAHAHTVTVLAIIYGSSFLSGLASLYTIQSALRGNMDQFPYGTGRLENACAFAYSLMLCCCASFALLKTGQRTWAGGGVQPQLELSSLPLLLSFVSNSIFLVIMTRGRRKTPVQTPISDSYYLMYSTASVRDGVTLVALLLGCLLLARFGLRATLVDGVISGVVSVFIIGHAIPVLVTNFRALVDFPLREEERLEIIRVLTRYFDEYESLGRIYNTRRGATVVVEIELGFPDSLRMGQLDELRRKMRADLAKVLPRFEFHLLPQRVPGAA